MCLLSNGIQRSVFTCRWEYTVEKFDTEELNYILKSETHCCSNRGPTSWNLSRMLITLHPTDLAVGAPFSPAIDSNHSDFVGGGGAAALWRRRSEWNYLKVRVRARGTGVELAEWVGRQWDGRHRHWCDAPPACPTQPHHQHQQHQGWATPSCTISFCEAAAATPLLLLQRVVVVIIIIEVLQQCALSTPPVSFLVHPSCAPAIGLFGCSINGTFPLLPL